MLNSSFQELKFESDVVPEDWRSDVIMPLYKSKLVDRVLRVTGNLIDDEQGDFTAGKGYADQIFTLKQIGEKAREIKRIVYVSFIDLEKAYDRVNREAF